MVNVNLKVLLVLPALAVLYGCLTTGTDRTKSVSIRCCHRFW